MEMGLSMSPLCVVRRQRRGVPHNEGVTLCPKELHNGELLAKELHNEGVTYVLRNCTMKG
jgi:hypothetical protein